MRIYDRSHKGSSTYSRGFIPLQLPEPDLSQVLDIHIRYHRLSQPVKIKMGSSGSPDPEIYGQGLETFSCLLSNYSVGGGIGFPPPGF